MEYYPILISCPYCASLHEEGNLLSGNTFGARYWTDGKMEAPMLPQLSDLGKCHHCHKTFWITDEIIFSEYRTYELPGRVDFYSTLRQAPHLGNIVEQDCYSALEAGLADTKEREKQLRILAWWYHNDQYRKESHYPSKKSKISDKCRENLERLSQLLCEKDSQENLMKAEIFRELAQFSKALILLEKILDEHSFAAASFIKKLCLDKNIALQEFPHDSFSC